MGWYIHVLRSTSLNDYWSAAVIDQKLVEKITKMLAGPLPRSVRPIVLTPSIVLSEQSFSHQQLFSGNQRMSETKKIQVNMSKIRMSILAIGNGCGWLCTHASGTDPSPLCERCERLTKHSMLRAVKVVLANGSLVEARDLQEQKLQTLLVSKALDRKLVRLGELEL